MKNKIRITLHALVPAAALLLSSNESRLSAQTLTLPANSNSTIFTDASQIIDFNTAMIGGGAGYIFGTVYTDGSGTENIYVNDPNNSALQASIAAGATYNGAPDVSIGNSTGTGGSICPSCVPNSDYILVNAYPDGSNNIALDFFKVSDNGSTTLSISYLSTTTIPGYTPPARVHIDAIADYTNSAPGVIHKFALSWCDYSNPMAQKVFVAEGDFNLGTVGAAHQLSTPASTGIAADVAGIQRFVGGSVHDVALVTWLHTPGSPSSPGVVYYREYDFTAGTTGTLTTVDQLTLPNVFSANPRIDAIDDYQRNGTGTNAVWAAVIEAGVSGNLVTRQYDNTTVAGSTFHTPTSPINLSTYFPGSIKYYNYAPTVSVAFDGTISHGFNYSVMQYTDVGTTMGSRPGYFAAMVEPLSWTSTSTFAGSCTGGCYYWVDGSGTPPFTVDADLFLTSTSAAQNDYSQPSLYAWAYFDTLNNDYEVAFKTSIGNGSSNYSFRKSPNSSLFNSGDTWHVFPNPADDVLQLANSAMQNETSAFTVTDMLGSVLMNGAIASGQANLDISKLPPGVYLLQIEGHGAPPYHTRFVRR